MTQHTLTIGPLSLLAEQHGPLLTITIHAPSDTAPVGKMTLTVPEWTALVALVDSLAVADRRHAEDRAEIERLSASVDRYQDAAWAGIEESSDNVECCAVGCSIVCASMNARASGWTINRNGLPFCFEHADRALNPTETKSDRDSLRQQCQRMRALLSSIRDDFDIAVSAHDPSDPRHRSHGGQHTNGRCCSFGNVAPGAVTHMRRLRDVIDAAIGKDGGNG